MDLHPFGYRLACEITKWQADVHPYYSKPTFLSTLRENKYFFFSNFDSVFFLQQPVRPMLVNLVYQRIGRLGLLLHQDQNTNSNRRPGRMRGTPQVGSKEDKDVPAAVHYTALGVSHVFACTATNWLSVLTKRQMVDPCAPVFEELKNIIINQQFFLGLPINILLSLATDTAVHSASQYFLRFMNLSNTHPEEDEQEDPLADDDASKTAVKRVVRTFFKTFVARGFSSYLATIALYPLHTLLTRVQLEGAASLFSSIDRSGAPPTPSVDALAPFRSWEGFQGLYKGLGLHLYSILPGAIVTFLLYAGVSLLVEYVYEDDDDEGGDEFEEFEFEFEEEEEGGDDV